jgi:hypothetical protein
MFTHPARDDADIVYRSVFRGQDRSAAGRIVPHGVFTDLEVAAVGLTEPAARAKGHQVVIGRQDFTGVVKARAIGNTRGLIKLVADATTQRILGCHIAGPDAGNLIHEAVIAMTCGATYRDIAAIHIHPTLAEGINAAARGRPPRNRRQLSATCERRTPATRSTPVSQAISPFLRAGVSWLAINASPPNVGLRRGSERGRSGRTFARAGRTSADEGQGGVAGVGVRTPRGLFAGVWSPER